MPDVDLPKAEHALAVLHRARLSRNDAAKNMLAILVYETANTGLRPPAIEEAHQVAWLAISELSVWLKEESFAPPETWNAAMKAIERWKESLIWIQY
jgi:hypothetical protein